MVFFHHFAKLVGNALRHHHGYACSETDNFHVRNFAQAFQNVFNTVVAHQQGIAARKQHVANLRRTGNIGNGIIDALGGRSGVFLSGKAAARAMAAIHGAHIGDEKEHAVGVSMRESRHGRVAVFVQRVFQIPGQYVQLVGGGNGLFADGAMRVVGVDKTQVIWGDSHSQRFERFAHSVFFIGCERDVLFEFFERFYAVFHLPFPVVPLFVRNVGKELTGSFHNLGF